jgi:hypothetical protein
LINSTGYRHRVWGDLPPTGSALLGDGCEQKLSVPLATVGTTTEPERRRQADASRQL